MHCEAYPIFSRLFKIEKQKNKDVSFRLRLNYPRLDDRFLESGTMKGHYFHQDLYVARRIYLANPHKYLDIGSRNDGFVAHVAVFREIEVMDVRDQISKVHNVLFKKADLMELPVGLVDAYDSISSLHAIEHFGLGRYGDTVDYYGHLKGIANIAQMLKSSGTLCFSVPIGLQRIEFNAHRVFSIRYLLEILQVYSTLLHFSFINDDGDLFENYSLTQAEIDTNCGCIYGCGIFELVRK